VVKYPVALTAAALLTFHPAQAGSDLATMKTGLLIGQPCQITAQAENNYLLPAATLAPVVINRASAVFALDEALVFIDPVGPQEQYRRFGRPDIVVLTSVRPTHLSIDTMIGLLRRDTVVLAPQAVIDQLPLMISNNIIAQFEPGMAQEVFGIIFKALPASATIPRGADVYRRDRGDISVLMEVGGAQIYF
jgi:hypothetical protein